MPTAWISAQSLGIRNLVNPPFENGTQSDKILDFFWSFCSRNDRFCDNLCCACCDPSKPVENRSDENNLGFN